MASREDGASRPAVNEFRERMNEDAVAAIEWWVGRWPSEAAAFGASSWPSATAEAALVPHGSRHGYSPERSVLAIGLIERALMRLTSPSPVSRAGARGAESPGASPLGAGAPERILDLF